MSLKRGKEFYMDTIIDYDLTFIYDTKKKTIEVYDHLRNKIYSKREFEILITN